MSNRPLRLEFFSQLWVVVVLLMEKIRLDNIAKSSTISVHSAVSNRSMCRCGTCPGLWWDSIRWPWRGRYQWSFSGKLIRVIVSCGYLAAGRLMGHILGALAEFERSLIVERTQAGLKAAKQRGQKLGRKRSLSDDQREHARALIAKGESPAAVAKLLNICRATLYNSLKE